MQSLVRQVRTKVREMRSRTLLGYTAWGWRRAPWHLSVSQVRGLSVLIGQAERAKATFVEHLVKQAIQNHSTLVILDAQGKYVRAALAHVPLDRTQDVTWIDFNDPTRAPGLNPIDMGPGNDPIPILEGLQRCGPWMWRECWERDVEDALGKAVVTLVMANETLVERNEPQFTLLDVPALFVDPEFRQRVVQEYVHNADVAHWWSDEFERARGGIHAAFLPALLKPLRRLESSPTLWHVLGQPRSTFRYDRMLRPGGIVLIDAGGPAKAQIRRWLVPVILDRINTTILARKPTSRWQRQSSTVIAAVGGKFPPIPYVPQPNWWGELAKRGAGYLLSDSSLQWLQRIGPDWPGALFASSTNVVLFRTTGKDAELIGQELGYGLGRKLPHLGDDECVVGCRHPGEALRLERIALLPPLHCDPAAAKRVLSRVTSCARPVGEIESDRRDFEVKWYGRQRGAIGAAVELDDPADKGDGRVNP